MSERSLWNFFGVQKYDDISGKGTNEAIEPSTILLKDSVARTFTTQTWEDQFYQVRLKNLLSQKKSPVSLAGGFQNKAKQQLNMY